LSWWHTLRQSINTGTISAATPQIAILLVIFFLFVGAITGALEIGTASGNAVRFSPSELFATRSPYSIPNLLAYPEFCFLVFGSITLAFLLPVLQPIAASALVTLTALPILFIGLNYPYREAPVPMQYSLLVLMVLFGVNVLINYFSEARRKQQLVEVFGRYMPPHLASQLSKHPDYLNLKGESRELTICFCDLINFTQMAERLPPQEVVNVLNEYFTVMTDVLYEHGATIDKYMGDCVMAFWGAPIPQRDHARRAVHAALEIQTRIRELTVSFAKRDLPAPDIGIGINTGVVNVGNMGSKHRMAYTVVGDPVNLAFRLESLTRTYFSSIIVGERTRELVDDVVFKELDTVTVRGKTTRTHIYQPLCYKDELSSEAKDELALHQQALEDYYAGRNREAVTQFQALAKKRASSDYYLRMIDQASLSPDEL
jgi:adenylate cyclase